MRTLRLPALTFLILLCAAAPRASEPRVTAALLTSSVSVQNGLADATFRVEVKNDEAWAMSDVFVVFADNVELAVGNVPAEGSATSDEMTRTFDVSHSASKYTAIPATLKYSVDGVAFETEISVLLAVEQ